MKITIRKGMFETNSSSTHVCIICKHDEEYKGFKEGKYCYWDKFYSIDNLEIEGYKTKEKFRYKDILKDLNEMATEDFSEKYDDIFYGEEIYCEEDLQDYLWNNERIMFYNNLLENYEENETSRDEIKVICFTGWD